MSPRKKKKSSNTGFFVVLLIIIIISAVVGYYTYPQWKPWFEKNILRKTESAFPKAKEKLSPLVDHTWVGSLDGAMLSIKSNGDFSVDFPAVEYQKTIYGHYKITGLQVIFIYHPSTSICVGVEGVYKFNITGKNLDLIPVTDPCKSRKEEFQQGWFEL